MRTIVVVVLALAICAFGEPGRAKAPHLATVAGPGIDGEVELRTLLGVDFNTLVIPLATRLTDRVSPHDAPRPPGFVFTWYAAHGDPLRPAVDRLIYYPAVGGEALIQVIEASGLFVSAGALGWYRVDVAIARELNRVIGRASQVGVHGVPGYAFAPKDGSDPTTWWRPVGGEGGSNAETVSEGRVRSPSGVAPGVSALAVSGVAGAAILVVRARRAWGARAHAVH